MPFLDLHRQFLEIRQEIEQAILSVLEDTEFVGGRHTSEFESAFSKFVGASHALGVANGTDALELTLESTLDGTAQEVIVPANSFIASSEAVSRSGHRVVFADVDEQSMTLDPADVERRITAHTGAVVAVHLYGHPAPMDRLRSLCDRHGLVLIEDAAQAHGASLRGEMVGTMGRAACFSFYPGKNLGAYGDAGAITTNHPELDRAMRMRANHGRLAKYDHAMEGRNSRLDGIQAAVLSVKLTHLERWTEHRRMLAAVYRDQLAGVGDLILPFEADGARHVYHLYVIRSAARDELRAFLSENQVSTGIHYPTALPRLRAYEDHGQHREPFLAAEMASRILSLPMGDSIRTEEVEVVCEAIRYFFRSR